LPYRTRRGMNRVPLDPSPEKKTCQDVVAPEGKPWQLLFEQHKLTIFDGEHGKGVQTQATVIAL
jgi:hypothetical protein